jgi:predicted branched-subunit amino acid permease
VSEPTAELPRSERSTIIRDGVAVGVATGTYGISFGAVSVAAGLDVLQTCALSLLMFTGASQFALIGVIGSGGAPMSGAMTALLLGSRNTLYGLRVAPLLAWRGWRRLVGSHLLIDESTAMSVNRESIPPASASCPPGCRSSPCGTSPPWSARSAVRRSATRARSVSTQRSARPSWR